MIVLGVILTLFILMILGVVLIWDGKQIKRKMDSEMQEFLAKFELEEEMETQND